MYTMLGGGAPGCAAASGTPPTLLADNAKTKTMTRRANFMQESPPQSIISCCAGLTTTLRQRPNAKSVSERIWQRSHHVRSNTGYISHTLFSQAMALQEIVRLSHRYNT